MTPLSNPPLQAAVNSLLLAPHTAHSDDNYCHILCQSLSFSGHLVRLQIGLKKYLTMNPFIFHRSSESGGMLFTSY